MYSAMYCMHEKYANNLPSQNSEDITGDSNPDIDGEKVPDKVTSRLCCSIDFQNLQRWKKLINNNSPSYHSARFSLLSNQCKKMTKDTLCLVKERF